MSNITAGNPQRTGQWTGSIDFGGTPAAGMNRTLGSWTRDGRVVRGAAYLSLTSKGVGTGSVTISGLPFTISNGDQYQGGVPMTLAQVICANFMFANLRKNSKIIDLVQMTAAGTASNMADTNFADNSAVQITFQYETDDA